MTPNLSPVEHIAEEDIEPLGQDPGALVLDDPVLHLPEPLLLLPGAQGHDCPHKILEVFDMLKCVVLLLSEVLFFFFQRVFYFLRQNTSAGNIK